jgi:RsiW-degrading membrane proteinase PrsW (M82 family)
MSVLNPLFSKTSRPRLLALLVPGIILVILTTLLFNANAGDELARTGDVTKSNLMHYVDTLAFFLLLMVFTIVYQICGKQKPWWVFPPVALTTIILMVIGMICGYFFNPPASLPLLVQYAIVGLREEFLKSIPVLLCLWIGTKASAPANERIGVREPLDGILIAAASATGFTAFETLTQYVPNTINQISQGAAGQLGQAASTAVGYLSGLELLIPRILNEFSGHVAWASYFGYFIGLSALMPKHRVKLLLIGFLTSAAMHDLWDSVNSIPMSPDASTTAQVVLGVLSFALLAAVIVKARQLSPSRAMNFATKINRTP